MSKKKKPLSPSSPDSPEVHTDAPGEKIFLCAACFLAGAAIMAVELAGNRLITPIFGNTLYTWTGLISVILVAIAVGDYVGGWLVDRYPNFRVLGLLFLLAGFFTVMIKPVLELFRSTIEKVDVVSGPIWVSLILFSIPACLLASVSPFTVRLLSRTLSDQKIGLSAGLVGMLGTLGSFLGTLATGLYLIPTVGLKAIFIGCAAIQFVVGLIAWVIFGKPKKAGGLVAAVLTFAAAGWLAASASAPVAKGVQWAKSSFYHDIRVIDEPYRDGNTARLLRLDTTHEGAQVLETGELLFDYQKFWKLSHVLTPHLKSALFIGGGGFGMPEHVSRDFPGADVTVVEIDPAVIEAGRKCFRLDEFPKVNAVAADGRRFLTHSDKKYDLIFGDAYSGVQSVPAHLTTQEFFRQVHGHLADRGVFMMNLIGAVQGKQSTYFRAMAATLRSVFPQVTALAVENPFSPGIQNIIFIASKGDVPLPEPSSIASIELRNMLDARVASVLLDGGKVITDDTNPAEHYVAMQVNADRRQ